MKDGTVKWVTPTRIAALVAVLVALSITLPVANGASVSRQMTLALSAAIAAIMIATLVEIWQWWCRSRHSVAATVILAIWLIVGATVLGIVTIVAIRLIT